MFGLGSIQYLHLLTFSLFTIDKQCKCQGHEYEWQSPRASPPCPRGALLGFTPTYDAVLEAYRSIHHERWGATNYTRLRACIIQDQRSVAINGPLCGHPNDHDISRIAYGGKSSRRGRCSSISYTVCDNEGGYTNLYLDNLSTGVALYIQGHINTDHSSSVER